MLSLAENRHVVSLDGELKLHDTFASAPMYHDIYMASRDASLAMSRIYPRVVD
jgi:hypothetical protein